MAVCGIIYGNQGIGKTTELARAFPNWQWILTRRSAINRARSEGIKFAKKPFLLNEYEPKKYTETGAPIRAKNKAEIYRIFKEIEASSPAPEGIVISEGTALIGWIYEETALALGTEGRARFELSAVVHRFISWLVGFESRTGIGILLECHRRDRTYYDTLQEKNAQKIGEVQYKAGPDFPEGRMIETATRPLSVVWEMRGEGDPIEKVEVHTRPGEYAVRKTSPLKKPGVAPIEILTDTRSLRTMLEDCGLLGNVKQ